MSTKDKIYVMFRALLFGKRKQMNSVQHVCAYVLLNPVDRTSVLHTIPIDIFCSLFLFNERNTQQPPLIYCSRIKMTSVCRLHFQSRFLDRTYLYFDQNCIDICARGLIDNWPVSVMWYWRCGELATSHYLKQRRPSWAGDTCVPTPIIGFIMI